ncbi:YfhD family protein [Anaerobacillus isosaccharinicus]|uniref:YfhD family protein n=1 Tax=Anaerobacillus isosaccharinicus TaxID=1532552 RepID=A0A1S2M604_9BACI|nr:YfhD family protein [Anaerobacillus isosaccharinicus]MBA5584915.1 YfhD family protein [Anaerobacillus isosaccharinicus]QOY36727.1 YfhD family protein [Anaerobacillus isosaccharinicus]
MAKKRDNKQNNDFVSDGRDIEFSQELADQDDLEAQERAREADARAKKGNK